MVDYPPAPVEEEVLRRYHQGFNAHDLDATGLTPVIQPSDLPAIRATINNITVEDGILRYITAISTATRRSPDLILGGSPAPASPSCSLPRPMPRCKAATM